MKYQRCWPVETPPKSFQRCSKSAIILNGGSSDSEMGYGSNISHSIGISHWISQESMTIHPILIVMPFPCHSHAIPHGPLAPGGSAEDLDLDPPAPAHSGCGRAEGARGARKNMFCLCHEKMGGFNMFEKTFEAVK